MRTMIVLASALTLVSCVENLVIDLGSEEAVAVDCILHKQDTQTLQLYKMKEVHGEGERAVDDATVFLSAYDKKREEYSRVAEFKHFNGTEWRASFEPEYGVRYKLVVNIPGKDEITAETTFPEDLRLMEYSYYYNFKSIKSIFPSIDSSLTFITPYFAIHKADSVWNGNENTGHGDENPKYIDGVRVKYKDYSQLYTDSCKLWIFPHVDSEYDLDHHPDLQRTMDKLKYPEWYDFHGSSKPYAEYVATDHPYADAFNIVPGTVSDLDWCNLPVKEYVYVIGSDSFYSFYANLSQWPRVVCPDLPLHSSFLRIAHPANFVNKKYKHELEYEQWVDEETIKHRFYIIADYSESFGNDDGRYSRTYLSCVNEVHFVSEEYDAYLKDLYTAKGAVDNFVLSAYEVKHIYSNVNGGYGIFGADYVTWDEQNCYYQTD